MKKGVILGATSILLASQIVTTIMPLAAKAEEKLVPNTEESVQSNAQVELPVPALPDQQIESTTEEKQEETSSSDAKEETAPEAEAKVETRASVTAEQTSEAVTATSEATVSTWAQLQTALMDNNVTDISLAADITLGATTIPTGLNKTIHGNGHTINANFNQIKLGAAGAVGKMENVKLTNTDIYGLFWSDAKNVTVTYKDVDHSGRQMIYLPYGELILDGKVSSYVTVEEIFQGNKMTVLPGATVDFESTPASRALSPVLLMSTDSRLTVGKDAHLNIVSNAANIWGPANSSLVNNGHMNLESKRNQAINLSTGSTMQFNTGSTFKAISGDTVEEAVEATSGSIIVNSGATFEVESNGVQGSIITGNQLVFANGSSFSITNHNRSGAVFGSYAKPTNVTIESAEGVQTWNRGVLISQQPSFNYSGPLSANFNIDGYLSGVTQTGLTSNNASFQNTFRTGNTGKIVGGSFAKVEIGSTTIDELTTESTTVTGTGEPNARVEIKANGTVIGSGTINSEGKYSVAIPKQAANTVVTAQATLQNLTSNVASTTVRDATATAGTITPNAHTVGDSHITGEYTGDVTSARLFVNGVSTRGGTFNADGTFSFFVTPGSIKVGDKVEIVALDKNGRELDRKNIDVISNLSGNIMPSSYTTGSSTITGEFTGDINFARLFVNGKHVSWGGTFNPDGTFSYYVTPGTIKAGDTVRIQGLHRDAAGNTEILDEQQVQIAMQGSITPDTYTLGTSNITGKFTGDVNFARLFVNGQHVSWGGTFNPDGTFSYFVNPSLIKSGDTVRIQGLHRDAAGNTEILDDKTVQIAGLKGTLTPSAYTLGTSNITGKFTGDINFGRLFINNQPVSWGGTFNSDGTFSFYVNSSLIKSGDKVEIQGLHRTANGDTEILAKEKVEIAGFAGTIAPNAYTPGSSAITGSYTGDVNFARLVINGVPTDRWGGTFTNGTFSFFVTPGFIKSGDKVEIQAMHRTSTGDTKVLDTKVVKINLQGTVSADPYTLGQATITGTFTGDVNFGRLYINGEHALWGGTYNEDGTFSFYVGRDLIKAGDVVKLEVIHRVSASDLTVLDSQEIEIK
jgi:hypothetical protein